MRFRTAAALLFTLLFWPKEAHLSQVHYRAISLEQVVARSELVVIATPAGERRNVEVPIGGDAPAFGYSEHPFSVSAVLKGELRASEKETLWVAGANLEQQFGLHKRYYLEKISKSPIYSRYEPKRAPGEGARVLFLRRTEFRGAPKVAFTVAGASEHVEARAAVEALLAPKPPAADP